MNFFETHSGDDPADGGRGHVLSFGLAHQRHAQVLDVEHHPLQQSLLGVRPVLRQLCNRGEPMTVTRESGQDLSDLHRVFLATQSTLHQTLYSPIHWWWQSYVLQLPWHRLKEAWQPISSKQPNVAEVFCPRTHRQSTANVSVIGQPALYFELR